MLIEYAFSTLDLNRIYLFTESENVIAQKLFEKVGFVREGLLHDDIISRGRFVDRYAYGLTKSDYFQL